MEINRKKNCFNFIRMIAAMQVFLGHASEHLNVALPQVMRSILSCFNGVPIFFLLSGFLIWDSIGHTAGFKQYAVKRFFRVYPELWGGASLMQF